MSQDDPHRRGRQTQHYAVAARLTTPRAVFLGWQTAPGCAPLALYNVTDRTAAIYRSTVSAATLVQHGIQVPVTPQPPEP
jgi:hypothetical protein